jgi:hypothetical protein
VTSFDVPSSMRIASHCHPQDSAFPLGRGVRAVVGGADDRGVVTRGAAPVVTVAGLTVAGLTVVVGAGGAVVVVVGAGAVIGAVVGGATARTGWGVEGCVANTTKLRAVSERDAGTRPRGMRILAHRSGRPRQ